MLKRFLSVAAFLVTGVTPALADEPVDIVSGIYDAYIERDGLLPEEWPALSSRIAPYVEAALQPPDGEVGVLDFDVFVNGQDWDFDEVEVEETDRSDADASVVARFDNFGEPQEVSYYFVNEGGEWLIDDIFWGVEGDSLWTYVMPVNQ
jgi:hypothetical protein